MLSQKSFEAVTSMFHKVSGIQLTDAKRALVAGRLQKLAQARGLSSVDQYVEQLMRDNDTEEMVRLVDKLTTNETYFFRDDNLWNWLREEAIPEVLRRAATGPVRIWSAAASTGQEGYSLAMLIDEMAREYRKTHPNVVIVQDAIPEGTYGQWVSTQLMGGTGGEKA